MKVNYYLIFLVSFFYLTFSHAQNIGIGTAVPMAKLEILGAGNTNATSALLAKNSSQKPLFYVRNDGKVGVGLTNIDAYYAWSKMTIAGQYGGESDLVLRVADSINFTSTPWLLFQTSDGTLSLPTLISNQGLGSLVGQGFDGVTYQTGAAINFLLDGTPAANDMPGMITFHTTQDGTVLNSERMRITNAGNVGIGTTTPNYRLTVGNGLSFGYGLGTAVYSSRTETRVNAGLQGNAGAQSGFFETSSPAPAANWPAGASSWWHLLDVRHSNDANIYAMQMSGSFFDQNFYVRKTNGAANTAWSLMMTSANIGSNAILNQNASAQSANYWISGNGYVNGNVGIGTSGPSSKLTIIVPDDKNDNPSDNGLYIYNGGNLGDNDDAILAARVAGANAGDPFVSFDVNGVTGWSIGLDNSDEDKLKFANNWANPGSSTKMTIQTNGNVGIGTTAPACGLHISTAEVSVGGSGIFLSGGASGNAAMELRGGANAHIDFANPANNYDYDMRLIETLVDRLQVDGGSLRVEGFRWEGWGNVGTFIENFAGTGDLSSSNLMGYGNVPISLGLQQWGIGSVFACYSDQRIKKNIRSSAAISDLAILRNLRVVDYQPIDYATNGTQFRKGFIAQEVEKVFPEAIGFAEQFIPNVYQLSQRLFYDESKHTLQITLAEKTDIKLGDKVRIILTNNHQVQTQVIAVEGNTITVDNWTEKVEKVFVFGKEVKDFRTIDYDRMAVLGVSAIQELDRKVSELEKLKSEMQEMRAEIKALKGNK